jgi:hypothetical protein
MEVKINKILEFAKCGINHNYPTGPKYDEYMGMLADVKKHLLPTSVQDKTKSYIECKENGCYREVKKEGDYCYICRGI